MVLENHVFDWLIIFTDFTETFMISSSQYWLSSFSFSSFPFSLLFIIIFIIKEKWETMKWNEMKR